MQIIEWPQFLESRLPLKEKKSSVTIGVFDGVHRGHRALIERVVSCADSVPVVITFRKPETNNSKQGTVSSGQWTVDREQKAEKADILSFQQRLDIFESLGIQITIVVDFTEEFKLMTGIEFLEILHKHGNIGFLAVGNNFRCGRGLDTGAEKIKDFFASRSITVEIVPEVTYGSLPISSSRIRSAIAGGNFELAEAMLGQDYIPSHF